MTTLLTHADILASVTMADAIEAMEAAFAEQGDGHVIQPQRLNTRAGKGWLRLGPAVMERSGWMGFKAMNLTPGQGMRYQTHLYRVASGELVAIMDAQHLTTLRTGATSAVATRRLACAGRTPLGLIGSGAEARAQAEAMYALGIASELRIFSRTVENRTRLATELAEAWNIPVRAVAAAREAVDDCGVVLAAVKSTETVLRGEWLRAGQHVNSVGTARPDQREIDEATFRRSALIIVDTREGVFGEAGDAIVARDSFAPECVFELADLVAGRSPGRSADDQITLFKSVGTAVQDVAIAACAYQRACVQGRGTEIGVFPMLKPA